MSLRSARGDTTAVLFYIGLSVYQPVLSFFSLLALYSILQPTNRISSNSIVTAESEWTNRISTIIRFKILALSNIRQKTPSERGTSSIGAD